MDRLIRATAQDWLAAARSAVVVSVTRALGSAPREPGTHMLVSATDVIGTVGGGHLELKAIQRARELLAAGPRITPLSDHVALGPALGQCCGGSVTLAYAALDAAALVRWPASRPLFHLQLYGAGHVGRAIATLLATLDASVDWYDERETEFLPTTTLGSVWPAHIRQVCVDAVEGEVRSAAPGAFYLVMTHDHDLDLRIAEAILRRADFAYFGLIGSRTKRQRFVHRLQARGVDARQLSRMSCPIGFADIRGKEPEVIAVAVLAQLMAAATQVRAAEERPTAEFGAG